MFIEPDLLIIQTLCVNSLEIDIPRFRDIKRGHEHRTTRCQQPQRKTESRLLTKGIT